MGNAEEPVLETETEVETEVETPETEEKADENKEPESIEESIEAAIKEIREQEGAGEEGEEEKEAKPGLVSESVPEVKEPEPQPKKVGRPKKEGEQIDEEDIRPPEFLEPKHKALLTKLPDKELKKGLVNLVKHYEATKTRVTQAVAAERKEIASIIDAVKPYVDQFTERNLTPSQGIGQLLVANKKLINTKDPETQVDEVVRIIQGCQIDPDAVYAKLTGAETTKGTKKIDLSNDPIIKELREENKRLREIIEPVHNERKQSEDVVYKTTKEKLESVQLETDQDGNYIRPELAEDAEFLEIWKPLVSRFVKKEGLDWDEAGKRAYQTLKGQAISKPNHAKIPTQNNLNRRSVSAATSVRGRTAPITNGVDTDDDVPAGETIEQSVMRAVQSLR